MRRIVATLVIVGLGTLCNAQPPNAALVLNRMSGVYRACNSIRVTTAVTRNVGEKQLTGAVSLAAERPARYLLEVTGAQLNTTVTTDGKALTIQRPDARVYSQTPAPAKLTGADILAESEVMLPASEIITLLLEGGLRSGDRLLGSRLASAKMSGPVQYGSRQAWVFSFDYTTLNECRLYVDTVTYNILRATLGSGSTPILTEAVTRTVFNEAISDDMIVRPVPEDYRQVSKLPRMPELQDDTPVSVKTLDGWTLSLPDLKGKVVVVTLFSTTSQACSQQVSDLADLHDANKDKGLEIVAVNATSESVDTIKAFAAQLEATFSFAQNKTTTDWLKRFGISEYPTTLVFNKEGVLVSKVVGYVPEKLTAALKKVGF